MLKTPGGIDPAGVEHAAEDAGPEVPIGDASVDLLLDPLDHLVTLVEVLDPGVAQQVVEHAGVPGRPLGGSAATDDHADEGEHREQAEEDDRHRPPRRRIRRRVSPSTRGLSDRARKRRR